MGDPQLLQSNAEVQVVVDIPDTSTKQVREIRGGLRGGGEDSCEHKELVACGESGDVRGVEADGEMLGNHTGVSVDEAHPLFKENSEEDSAHTSPLSPSVALPPPSLSSSALVPCIKSSSRQTAARLRNAERILPPEIWAQILSDLSHNEKVANTRTCRLFGDIIEDELYREVELDMHTVLSWTAGVSRYTHRANTMRTLEITLEGASKDDLREIVPHLRNALHGLPALEEFALLDVQELPPNAAEDIFKGVEFSLTKFACDSDEIIVQSWESLKKQTKLKEFRGLLDYTRVLQSDVRPDVFSNLKVLDTSTTFAMGVSSASTISNLSIWMAYHQVCPALSKITEALGENLSSLRVIRHMMKSPNPNFGTTFAPEGSQLSRYWERHSPIEVCAAIRAPRLKYLEINDVCSDTEQREWPRTRINVIRDDPARHAELNMKLRTECVPSLRTLVWWPAWADSVSTVILSQRRYVIEFYALLPIVDIVLPPLVSWDREGEQGGWTSVERDDSAESRRGTLPQQWYDKEKDILNGDWKDVDSPYQSRWDQ
ncbi:hypothetical protein C8Q70DRAFT_935729 [Cubamyces menziesii]|nr:hypothetical protein C8Q70DRAFT_935729 [Cubamyces menziesii]